LIPLLQLLTTFRSAGGDPNIDPQRRHVHSSIAANSNIREWCDGENSKRLSTPFSGDFLAPAEISKQPTHRKGGAGVDQKHPAIFKSGIADWLVRAAYMSTVIDRRYVRGAPRKNVPNEATLDQ
jgi:hypothetical protein